MVKTAFRQFRLLKARQLTYALPITLELLGFIQNCSPFKNALQLVCTLYADK